MNTIADVVTAAERDGVDLIRFAFCDLAGVSRCKAIHVSQLQRKLHEGVSLSRAQLALNVVDQLIHIEDLTPVGEVRLRADPETYVVLPRRPATAMLWCDLIGHDRESWAWCPRSALRRVLDTLLARDIEVRASFEVEFYLGHDRDGRFTKLPHRPVYSLTGHDASAPVLHEITDALVQQGFEVEQAINEYGSGQQEVVIRHLPALQAADGYLTVKDTIRAVSAAHGYAVSFAPKPFAEEIGSGAHLHLSLWDRTTGANMLYDPSAQDALGGFGRGFLAGLQQHLPALVAITAPSVNSYLRLGAGNWSSATTAWGFDNREAALRVASPFYGREDQTYNIEFKPLDGAANPYLALAAILHAGVSGVDLGLELAPAASVDPARMSKRDRRRLNIRPLPPDLGEAVANMAADATVRGALGEQLAAAYLTLRRSEIEYWSEVPLEEQLGQIAYVY